jgi:hypothetical protein
MFTRAKSLGSRIGLALMACGCVCALAAMPVLAQNNAQSGPQPIGELLVAHGASVDGVPAAAGLTFVNGSRVKTEANGWATINLGRDGRIKIGPESEMLVTTSPAKIGGELLAGWAVVSASKGVEVAVKTADGLAVADGHQPTVLTIDVVAGNTRVESRGEAKVAAGAKTEAVAAGEEVTVARSAEAEGIASFSRRSLEDVRAVSAPVVTASVATEMASLMASSVRQSISTITLNRASATPNLAAGGRSINSTEALRVTGAQAVDTGCSPIPCPNCQIEPVLVKGKAGCVTNFNVRIDNIPAEDLPSVISVRPFFSGACFFIFPSSPQQITLPSGGVYPFSLNATNCPANANKQPQNSVILIQTSTCGTATIQVEWATPCRF